MEFNVIVKVVKADNYYQVFLNGVDFDFFTTKKDADGNEVIKNELYGTSLSLLGLSGDAKDISTYSKLLEMVVE